METTQVTLDVRAETSPGEVIAVVGSCEALGNWNHQNAVILHLNENNENTWTATIAVPKGVVSNYRYFKGFFLEAKAIKTVGYMPTYKPKIWTEGKHQNMKITI